MSDRVISFQLTSALLDSIRVEASKVGVLARPMFDRLLDALKAGRSISEQLGLLANHLAKFGALIVRFPVFQTAPLADIGRLLGILAHSVPAVTSWTLRELSDAEDRVGALLNARVSLRWEIDLDELPDFVDPDEVLAVLRSIPAYVERPYLLPIARNPSGGDPADDAPLRAARHLEGERRGVGVKAAWDGWEGGQGEYVRLADVEADWNESHREFVGLRVERANSMKLGAGPAAGAPLPADTNHGTKVLGTLAARRDGRAVDGIAPRVPVVVVSSRVHGKRTNRVADAIYAALRWLCPGDVLLLEVDWETPLPGPKPQTIVRLPARFEEAARGAIQHAIARGIVVIEAAGNSAGTFDLARLPAPGPGWAHANSAGWSSVSDAVVVTGGYCAIGSTDWALYAGVTYGAPVLCFAQAHDIPTTTGPDTESLGMIEIASQRYVTDFGGTSAASAIVAGAAAVLQSIHRAAGGYDLAKRNGKADGNDPGLSLSPATMHKILSDPEVNTTMVHAGRTYVMPDVSRILAHEKYEKSLRRKPRVPPK